MRDQKARDDIRRLEEAEARLAAGETVLCDVCGKPLFMAIPHKTSREVIRSFLETCTFLKPEERQQMLEEGWIHPGTYCPNGCTNVATGYDSSELWKSLKKINRKYGDDLERLAD